MNIHTKRAIEAFLSKTMGPTIYQVISHRGVPTDSEIEKDLAKQYGEIADRMAGKGKTCPDPELATRITREVFEAVKKEVEEGKTPDKEKIKKDVAERLGLES